MRNSKSITNSMENFTTATNIATLLYDTFSMNEEGLISVPSTMRTKSIFSRSGITINELNEIMQSASQKVNECLEDMELILSRQQLKQLNTFDFRTYIKNKGISYGEEYLGKGTSYPLFRQNDVTKLMFIIRMDNNILDKYPFFYIIPCFEEAVVKLNTNRWLYWKILELNIDENRCLVKLQDYAGTNSNWSAGATGVWELTPNNIECVSFQSADNLISQAMSVNIDFTEDEKYVYKQLFKHANILKTKDNELQEEEACKKSLLTTFLLTTMLINKGLSSNKLSKGKVAIKTASNKKVKTELTPEQPQEAKKKLVRTLIVSKENDANNDAEILITSDKVPKVPSEEYVRHYSVAAWKTRATVRHYKSGKTAYVKECVHHRHALQKDSEESEVAKREYKVK